jgi:hypothetical protein
MKKIAYKISSSISYFKKKIFSKNTSEGILHHSDEPIETIFFRNPDGEVRALMDVNNEELWIIPPSNDKQTHKVYSQLCDALKEKYIDKSSDFYIAVPMTWYLKMAHDLSPERYQEGIEFRKKALIEWEKYKKAAL